MSGAPAPHQLGMTKRERYALGGVVFATVAAGVAHYGGAGHVLAFALATIALAGLAWIVSLGTEQVGLRIGPAVTGFLHSTLGNLPEFFVVLFALRARELTVAQSAIVGSILANALFVLGLVIVAGVIRAPDRLMRFSARLPNDTATLLLLATFIIVLIGLTIATHDAASHHTTAISVIGAIAILIVYGIWAIQYLRAEQGGPGQQSEQARLSAPAAIILLAAGAGGSAFVSEWFVDALQPTIETLHISQAFAGLVIVSIAGNAVENVTGIAMAYRGHSDLAIAVVKNSVAQIAAFLYPVLVLVSLLTVTTLTFALAPVYIGALFGTAVIVWQITGDGEATAFEGAALIATFVILATVAAYE